MLHKLMGGIAAGAGFALVFLGVGCVDSPSLRVPMAMIATGMVFLGAYAGMEQKWTEN